MLTVCYRLTLSSTNVTTLYLQRLCAILSEISFEHKGPRVSHTGQQHDVFAWSHCMIQKKSTKSTDRDWRWSPQVFTGTKLNQKCKYQGTCRVSMSRWSHWPRIIKFNLAHLLLATEDFLEGTASRQRITSQDTAAGLPRCVQPIVSAVCWLAAVSHLAAFAVSPPLLPSQGEMLMFVPS